MRETSSSIEYVMNRELATTVLVCTAYYVVQQNGRRGDFVTLMAVVVAEAPSKSQRPTEEMRKE